MKIAIVVVVFLVALLIPGVFYFRSTETGIVAEPAVSVIGMATPVRFKLQNAHGVKEVSESIEQNGKRYPVGSAAYAKSSPKELTVEFGKTRTPELTDGKARIVVRAKSNDLRGKTNEAGFDVTVVTAAPRVSADGEEHLINQGGMELVVFTPTGYVTDSGVEVGAGKYRSFPLPSDPETRRFSFFAYPWDTPVSTAPRVYVSNPAGAVAYASFRTKIKGKAFRSRDIVIDDKFLEKVVNQIEPNGKGELLERFLHINRDLRKQNNQTLTDLRLKSEPKMLWSGAFLPMVNSTVESYFADKRSYIYKGKKVDEQVHLGFDLAKVAHSPIPASNDGKVLWASDLGIYGNCVVLDHGYGLQSIYGHMSEIGVKVGDAVKKGQELGKSGATGLAGGDHLHFSMQIDGVQINPVEWWDAHWIKDRVLSKLK